MAAALSTQLLSILRPAPQGPRTLDQVHIELAAWWNKQPLKKRLHKTWAQQQAAKTVSRYLGSNEIPSVPDMVIFKSIDPLTGATIELDPPVLYLSFPPSSDHPDDV